ncbi:unnamed protein product [Periconia digitata]|uniref:Uncharacterized protein n=1 Tax=Periconia digitata TaxID=1303443 RepID=A0A9W4XV48_9PLEO|nr:unnamed protein product [Periconia digitata]
MPLLLPLPQQLPMVRPHRPGLCTPPPNVFPQTATGQRGRAVPSLIWDREYEITWKSELEDDVVTIQWWMLDALDVNESHGNGTRYREHLSNGLSGRVVWEYSKIVHMLQKKGEKAYTD